jgi:hypothetical protein
MTHHEFLARLIECSFQCDLSGGRSAASVSRNQLTVRLTIYIST